MERVLEVLRNIISVLVFMIAISLLLAYEVGMKHMIEKIELEILWNHLVNFGMLF